MKETVGVSESPQNASSPTGHDAGSIPGGTMRAATAANNSKVKRIVIENESGQALKIEERILAFSFSKNRTHTVWCHHFNDAGNVGDV